LRSVFCTNGQHPQEFRAVGDGQPRVFLLHRGLEIQQMNHKKTAPEIQRAVFDVDVAVEHGKRQEQLPYAVWRMHARHHVLHIVAQLVAREFRHQQPQLRDMQQVENDLVRSAQVADAPMQAGRVHKVNAHNREAVVVRSLHRTTTV